MTRPIRRAGFLLLLVSVPGVPPPSRAGVDECRLGGARYQGERAEDEDVCEELIAAQTCLDSCRLPRRDAQGNAMAPAECSPPRWSSEQPARWSCEGNSVGEFKNAFLGRMVAWAKDRPELPSHIGGRYAAVAKGFERLEIALALAGEPCLCGDGRAAVAPQAARVERTVSCLESRSPESCGGLEPLSQADELDISRDMARHRPALLAHQCRPFCPETAGGPPSKDFKDSAAMVRRGVFDLSKVLPRSWDPVQAEAGLARRLALERALPFLLAANPELARTLAGQEGGLFEGSAVERIEERQGQVHVLISGPGKAAAKHASLVLASDREGVRAYLTEDAGVDALVRRYRWSPDLTRMWIEASELKDGGKRLGYRPVKEFALKDGAWREAPAGKPAHKEEPGPAERTARFCYGLAAWCVKGQYERATLVLGAAGEALRPFLAPFQSVLYGGFGTLQFLGGYVADMDLGSRKLLRSVQPGLVDYLVTIGGGEVEGKGGRPPLAGGGWYGKASGFYSFSQMEFSNYARSAAELKAKASALIDSLGRQLSAKQPDGERTVEGELKAAYKGLETALDAAGEAGRKAAAEAVLGRYMAVRLIVLKPKEGREFDAFLDGEIRAQRGVFWGELWTAHSSDKIAPEERAAKAEDIFGFGRLQEFYFDLGDKACEKGDDAACAGWYLLGVAKVFGESYVQSAALGAAMSLGSLASPKVLPGMSQGRKALLLRKHFLGTGMTQAELLDWAALTEAMGTRTYARLFGILDGFDDINDYKEPMEALAKAVEEGQPAQARRALASLAAVASQGAGGYLGVTRGAELEGRPERGPGRGAEPGPAGPASGRHPVRPGEHRALPMPELERLAGADLSTLSPGQGATGALVQPGSKGYFVSIPIEKPVAADKAPKLGLKEYESDYHITIIEPGEFAALPKETQQRLLSEGVPIPGKPRGAGVVKRKIHGTDADGLFMNIDWPEAQRFREALGLPPKNLHATLSGGVGEAIRSAQAGRGETGRGEGPADGGAAYGSKPKDLSSQALRPKRELPPNDPGGKHFDFSSRAKALADLLSREQVFNDGEGRVIKDPKVELKFVGDEKSVSAEVYEVHVNGKPRGIYKLYSDVQLGEGTLLARLARGESLGEAGVEAGSDVRYEGLYGHGKGVGVGVYMESKSPGMDKARSDRMSRVLGLRFNEKGEAFFDPDLKKGSDFREYQVALKDGSPFFERDNLTEQANSERYKARVADFKRYHDQVRDGTAVPPKGVAIGKLQDAVLGIKEAYKGPEGELPKGTRIPLLFKSPGQYLEFINDLDRTLRAAVITDAVIQMVGSGTKGKTGNPNKPFKDWRMPDPEELNSGSDGDLCIFSEQALKQGWEMGTPANKKIVLGGEHTILKNEFKVQGVERGFDGTKAGKVLKAFVDKWNKRLYNFDSADAERLGVEKGRKVEVDGLDFKCQLEYDRPFQDAEGGAITVLDQTK